MIRRILLSCLLTAGFALAHAPAADVSLTVHPERVVNRIDEKVYGHFLEHIYHSCNGGLWREHYAPQRIALEGRTDPLNAVATKSEDGKTLYVKAVNPSDEAVQVQLQLAGGATGKASLHLVAPGDLAARNTLETRDAVQPKPSAVQKEGPTLRFTLPPISCGVVEIDLKESP